MVAAIVDGRRLCRVLERPTALGCPGTQSPSAIASSRELALCARPEFLISAHWRRSRITRSHQGMSKDVHQSCPSIRFDVLSCRLRTFGTRFVDHLRADSSGAFGRVPAAKIRISCGRDAGPRSIYLGLWRSSITVPRARGIGSFFSSSGNSAGRRLR